MVETKYGKYIITELKPHIKLAPWAKGINPEELTRVLFLDDEVVKGAFFTQCVWFWPRDQTALAKDDVDAEPHKHHHDEILGLFGTNMEDPHDLCGEVEIFLNGEKHIITMSCLIFVPKGLTHGPIRFNRIDRPVFQFAVRAG